MMFFFSHMNGNYFWSFNNFSQNLYKKYAFFEQIEYPSDKSETAKILK